MTDTRNCEQCGAVFTPRREHARFDSARCRAAWNSQNMGDSTAGMSALGWSATAMRDVTERLPGVLARDEPLSFAVIGEAVWWVTIVDATLVRHHPEAYDGEMARQPAAERRLIEGILGGLRFVRNRMGSEVDQVDFIEPTASRSGDGFVTAWRWKPVPEPCLDALSPRGQAWEMTRYRAYEAYLAGHTIGEVFGRAVAFLTLITAKVASATDISASSAF